MEKDFANYDLIDRMIANERKAKSWTAFWITLLCILAGLLIWAIVSIAEKKKTIKEQYETLKNTRDTILNKDALINSLREDCNRDITKFSDSIKQEVDITLSQIAKIDSIAGSGRQSDNSIKITKSIRELDKKFKQLKTDIQKEKIRLFIQYNNPGDIDKVNQLIATLKNKSDYLVTPPELVRSKYQYLIKCFNYEDAQKENWLKKLLNGSFKIDTDKINLTHEKKKGMSPTIEIWLGSPDFQPVQQQLIQNKLNDKKL